MILLNFIFGLILVIVIVIMTFIDSTRNVAKKLVYLFKLVPSFALGDGLLNVVFTDFFGQLDGKTYTVYSNEISGCSMIYMAIETVVFFALTLLLEWLIRRPTFLSMLQGAALPSVPDSEKDMDVLKEEARLEKTSDEVVVIKGKSRPLRPPPLSDVASPPRALSNSITPFPLLLRHEEGLPRRQGGGPRPLTR